MKIPLEWATSVDAEGNINWKLGEGCRGESSKRKAKTMEKDAENN